MDSEYRSYTVRAKAQETPSVTVLELLPRAGERPSFIPGQFVNIQLPARGPEAKSYTICSGPRDAHLSIAVRAAGNFSRALCALKVGGELLLSEPVGYFYPEDGKTPRVFVAGGIGVMPFISIMRAAPEEGSAPQTLLLYSNRTAEEAAFLAALGEFAARKNFSVRHFLTREYGTLQEASFGRIGARDLSAARRLHPKANFFVCGSIAFVRDMRLLLKGLGVPEEAIYTESYF